MAEEFEREDAARAAEADGDMAAIALGLAGASRRRADEYLAKQGRLTDLRIEFVEQQDRLELAHLRFRHWSDWAKFGLQVAGGLLAFFLLIAVAAAIWNASQADGLVVDAFSVPPDFAARGIGGEVVAQDVTNKLFAIRALVDATSYSSAGDISRDRTSDMRVEIPETGISLGEAWRVLKSWLGNQHHISGSLRRRADGTLLLDVTLDTGAAITASGKDLDTLEQNAAEQILCTADAASCVNYLVVINRWDEIEQHARAWLAAANSPEALAQSYGILGAVQGVARNNLEGGLGLLQLAVAYAPKQARPLITMEAIDAALGRSEDDVSNSRKILALDERDQPRRLQGRGFAQMWQLSKIEIARWTGDIAALRRLDCVEPCSRQNQFATRAFAATLAHDLPAAEAALEQARLGDDYSDPFFRETEAALAVQKSDWRAVTAAAGEGLKAYGTISSLWDRMNSRPVEIDLIDLKAVAEGELGDPAAARATLAQTGGDCYPCLIARGDVEAVARNWDAARTWYARAAQQGPSLPFADFRWGAMLLAKGDLDGAITHFAEAHKRGPHFADPLEMWGETLILQNRSDLAAAKFAEAAQYAPNWGRLHLKWGEALHWLGRDAEARKQFAAAAKLDRTSAERQDFARWSHV